MSDSTHSKTLAMGLLGAAVGGALGYFAFEWLYRRGYYALIAPPALLGLIAGWFARRRSQTLAVICGVAGVLLTLFTEWRFRPFKADRSLLFFVTHLHDLEMFTLILVALGAFFSYRFALRYDAPARPAERPGAAE